MGLCLEPLGKAALQPLPASFDYGFCLYSLAVKENCGVFCVFFFFSFLFYIGAQLINVVLVSGVQQGDSVIHTHASFLFQILFPIRLLQNTEQNSLCYTESSYWFL